MTTKTTQKGFNNPMGATEGDPRAYDPSRSQTTKCPHGPFVIIRGVICYQDTKKPVRGADLKEGKRYEVRN
jgi:hypothetical protein